MTEITIYTTMLCPYCHSAKRLLGEKNVAYSEIDVTFDPAGRRQMTELAGKTSVPQIFVGKTHVGGCDELYALEGNGELDKLLSV
ncbi:MAG: glutaredoxin 3 [Rhizobiales bacterium]|nr:glutaredoxin 3 [Hyphomicrobiales bacterium]